jgi:hypothetical protein
MKEIFEAVIANKKKIINKNKKKNETKFVREL